MPGKKKPVAKRVISEKKQPEEPRQDGVLQRLGHRIVSAQVKLRAFPTHIKNRQHSEKNKKKYRSFRLQKRIKPEPCHLPTAGELFKQSLKFIWRWRTVFLAMVLIHAVIYFLLIRGPVPEDNINTIRESVEVVLGQGASSTLKGNVTTLGAVLSTKEGSAQNPLLLSTILIILSLVYIWAIRQLANNKSIAARDAYYQGPTALLPTLLLIGIISLQLLPFAIASFVYSVAKNGQIFVSGAEDLSFFVVTMLIGLLSFYWLTSSIIALYIVTLPGMYPMQALKAARKLVHFQRLAVFRRIVALPLVLGLIYFSALLLVVRFIPNQTYLAVDIFQLILLPFVHVYLYKLYRSLI